MERLTRYWIIFQHHLNANEDFVRDDGKQNTEQLTNTLVPLQENYKYAHMLGQPALCAHEAEFQAYGVLLTGDLKQALKGGVGVSRSPEVRLAVDVLTCVETDNFARFFSLLRRAPYLPGCLMAKYVERMREKALEVWGRAYNPTKARGTAFRTADVLRALCMQDEDELKALAVSRPWVVVGEGREAGSTTVRRATAAEREGGLHSPGLSMGGAAGVAWDEEKRLVQRRKARAAMILKSSFPFVPAIEAKADGVPFRDLTRGWQGALSLSRSWDRQMLPSPVPSLSSRSTGIAPPPFPASLPSPSTSSPPCFPTSIQKTRPTTRVPPALGEVRGATEAEAGLLRDRLATPADGSQAKRGATDAGRGEKHHALFPQVPTAPSPLLPGSSMFPPAPAFTAGTLAQVTKGKRGQVPWMEKTASGERVVNESEGASGRTGKGSALPSVPPSKPALLPSFQKSPVAEPVGTREGRQGGEGGMGGDAMTEGRDRWMESMAGTLRRGNTERVGKQEQKGQSSDGKPHGGPLPPEPIHDSWHGNEERAQALLAEARLSQVQVAARKGEVKERVRRALRKLSLLHTRRRRRQAWERWVAVARHEQEQEDRERLRFETVLATGVLPPHLTGAAPAVSASSLLSLLQPLRPRLPLSDKQVAGSGSRPHRRFLRFPSSVASLRLSPSLPPILPPAPLDLPKIVGNKLWARHRQDCVSLLDPRHDPAPPSLLGWKLAVVADAMDPAGAWLLGALTLPSISSPSTSSSWSTSSMFWRKGSGDAVAKSGKRSEERVLWKAEHRLARRGEDGAGEEINLSLCVKMLSRESIIERGEDSRKEVAHALLFHLPAPGFAEPTPDEGVQEGGEGGAEGGNAYWRACKRDVRALVGDTTPGIPLLICLGPEAAHALDTYVDRRAAERVEKGLENDMDVRQKIAVALELGQRGFLTRDAEAVGFEWEVCTLPPTVVFSTGALAASGGEDEGLEKGNWEARAREALGDALGFLGETCPGTPLLVRETLVSVVGRAVRKALWKGKGNAKAGLRPAVQDGGAGRAGDVFEATPAGCQQTVNQALADVRDQLCAPALSMVPWPVPEFASIPTAASGWGSGGAETTKEKGGATGVVPRALWSDMTRVGFRSPASPRPGQRAARGLFGLRRRRIPNGFAEGKPTAAVGTGYGLALGWNDPRRLLRLENLLDAVALPALPPSLSEEQDPVRWVERYLQVLREEGSGQGWSLGVSAQLAQFARGLALEARAEWYEEGRGGEAGPVAPWNRLFTAMVVDRLSLGCGRAGDGIAVGTGGAEGPPLRWAYHLHGGPNQEGEEGGREGTSLREYQEMDLDEGHGRAHEDFFHYREATSRRLGSDGGWSGGIGSLLRSGRRRKRAGRAAYALDAEMAMVSLEESAGGAGKGGREGDVYEDPSSPGRDGQGGNSEEGEGGGGRKRARRVSGGDDMEPVHGVQPSLGKESESGGIGGKDADSLASLSRSLARESKAWGGAMSFLKAFL